MNEPFSEELERLLTDEERDELGRPNVPDEVRAEMLERLQRRAQAERDEGQPDNPSDSDRPVV